MYISFKELGRTKYFKENYITTTDYKQAYNFPDFIAGELVFCWQKLWPEYQYFLHTKLPIEYIPKHGEKFTCNNLPNTILQCIDEYYISSKLYFINNDGTSSNKNDHKYMCYAIDEHGNWYACTKDDNDILTPIQ